MGVEVASELSKTKRTCLFSGGFRGGVGARAPAPLTYINIKIHNIPPPPTTMDFQDPLLLLISSSTLSYVGFF